MSFAGILNILMQQVVAEIDEKILKGDDLAAKKAHFEKVFFVRSILLLFFLFYKFPPFSGGGPQPCRMIFINFFE